jgi:CMP-N-acetylneuraminic acid synthetase
MKEIVAVVPVKGQSERVTAKNLRPFGDTNLYELKLKHLQQVRGFKAVYVSSESPEVLATAKRYGFETHVRDPQYSTSHVPMSEVYSYVASEVPGEHIAWINVTNPLTEAPAYEGAIQAYEKMGSDYDCLLSAYEVKDYLFYEGKPVGFKSNPWPRSQDLKGMVNISFAVNILKRKDMIEFGSCVGRHPYFYILNARDSMDIDFPEDFEIAEFLYKKRRGLK